MESGILYHLAKSVRASPDIKTVYSEYHVMQTFKTEIKMIRTSDDPCDLGRRFSDYICGENTPGAYLSIHAPADFYVTQGGIVDVLSLDEEETRDFYKGFNLAIAILLQGVQC